MNKRTLSALAAVLLCVALAGCRNRARLATDAERVTPEPGAIVTIEPAATASNEIQTPKAPQPIDASGTVDETDLGPLAGWLALAALLLLFVGICGGAMYLYAAGIGAAIIRRNSHLFTHGGKQP